MRMRWLLVCGLALMTSCGRQIPDDIIQPQQMEELLYDYHLAIGMSTNLKVGENYKKDAYKKYIFQKYGIEEADFDSSMVWYTRNALELASIYENLDKRFRREHSHIEMLMESRQEADVRITSSGDTVDIWGKRKMYWMNGSSLLNQLAFEIKADTNFKAMDTFDWSADYHFLPKGKVAMGLNIIYDNDSVVGEVKEISASGRHSICLHADSVNRVKVLNGFIYVLPEDSALHHNLLVNQISLMRYHAIPDSIQGSSEVIRTEEPPKKLLNDRLVPSRIKDAETPR